MSVWQQGIQCLLAVAIALTLCARVSAQVLLEADHLTIQADDGISASAVRELALSGHALWNRQGGVGPADLAPAHLSLEAGTPAPAAQSRSRGILWNQTTTEQEVIRALAECWWEALYGGTPEETKGSWQIDGMVVALLVHLQPARVEQWLRAAGSDPLSGKQLTQTRSPTNERLMAQRWLLRAWQLESGSARRPQRLDAETRWAAYFLQRRASLPGPFLSLELSAERLSSLGRINVLRRGAEGRIWIFELPRAERVAFEDAWQKRSAQLRVLLPRVHPVYHRAAVALAGSLEGGPQADEFAALFPEAWSEAQGTAEEIRTLLKLR